MYQGDNEPYDVRDENYASSEDEAICNYCEVCDREFKTAELLDRHAESHKTCGIEGCTFSAHPKLVEKHISMQHCTGLYHRMKNLSTPEDISTWIAERKKKYPTKINIEQKISEETEKRDRGEIIAEQTRSIPESKHTDKMLRDRKRKVRRRKNREIKPSSESFVIVETYRGLRPFAGTAGLQIDDENTDERTKETKQLELAANTESSCSMCADFEANISDDEEQPINAPRQIGASSCASDKPHPANAGKSCLASLVANYGTDSSDDDAPDQIPIKRAREEIDNNWQQQQQQQQQQRAQVSRKNPDIMTAASIQDEEAANTKTWKTSARPLVEKLSTEKYPLKTAPSGYRNKKRFLLLQRLLSRSIQHERNIICQCIKYIADNDFFD